MQALVNQIVEALGPVDILVNNAGFSHLADAAAHTIEDWQRVMDVNVTCALFLSQEIARRCTIHRRRGRIVNFSSIGGLGGPDDMKGSPPSSLPVSPATWPGRS